MRKKEGQMKKEGSRVWGRQRSIEREQIYRADKTVPNKRGHSPAHKHRKCLMDMQTLSMRPEQKKMVGSYLAVGLRVELHRNNALTKLSCALTLHGTTCSNSKGHY